MDERALHDTYEPVPFWVVPGYTARCYGGELPDLLTLVVLFDHA